MNTDVETCRFVSPNGRRLQLNAIPSKTELANIEFDLTLDCNLRCRYCYKGENRQVYMPRRVAFDAVIWLIHASGSREEIKIFLLGGEPLMHFSLIKELIPFGVRRARQQGKMLTFGMTTNCTLVTDEVIEFFKKWGAKFHTSIDGVPEIQDKNRPTATGGPSSHLVERAAAKILAYDPQTAARCTYDPKNVHWLYDNYQYFRSLGYTNIVMMPSLVTEGWSEEILGELERQYRLIADMWIDEMRQGRHVFFKHFEDYFRNKDRTQRGTCPCGAGRFYGVINANGDYFPCSRWAIQKREVWSAGNIYDCFREEAREELLKGFTEDSFSSECATCDARCICNGGCLAENLETLGTPFAVIPVACKIMRIRVRIAKHVHDTLYKEKNPTFMQKYYEKEGQKESQSCKLEEATHEPSCDV